MYTYAKNRSTSKYKMSVIVYMIDASLQPLLMAWHHRLQHIVLLYHLCLFQFPLFDAGSWVLAKWTSLWDVMFGQYSQDLICDFLQVLTHTDPHERPTRLSRLTCSLWCDFFFFFFEMRGNLPTKIKTYTVRSDWSWSNILILAYANMCQTDWTWILNEHISMLNYIVSNNNQTWQLTNMKT